MSQAQDLEWSIHQAYNAHLSRNYGFQLECARKALALDSASHLASTLLFLALWESGQRDEAADFLLERVRQSPPKGYEIFCLVLAYLKVGAPSDNICAAAYAWLKLVKYDARGDDETYRQGADIRILRRARLAEKSTIQGEALESRFGAVRGVKTQSHNTNNRWSQPSFHVVENMYVKPKEWFVFDDENIYIDELLSWPDKWSEHSVFQARYSPSFIAECEGSVVVNLPKKKTTIREPCILLGSNSNFFYWLTENLARLRTVESVYDLSNYKILVDDQLSDIHLGALEMLGFRPASIIQCSEYEVLECSELLVPGLLFSVDVLHKAGVSWLREKFMPKSTHAGYPEKVFISRSKSHRRPFVNEAEIENVLHEKGYVTVVPDSLSFQEQVECVQNAVSIVSPYGTCLTVSIFAPETCKIFELIDEKVIPLHRFIENISSQIGQSFTCVPMTLHKDSTKESLSEGGFSIEPRNLLAHIEPCTATLPLDHEFDCLYSIRFPAISGRALIFTYIAERC